MKKLNSIAFLFLGPIFAQVLPLSLEQAVQEALEHNLDLAAEKLGVGVSEARQITAALRPNPVVTLQGQTLALLGTRFVPASPAGPNQLNIHTDYVLERGHKRQERMAVAAEDRKLAEWQLREFVRRLVFDVQSAFVDVQRARAAVDLAGQNLKSLQGIVAVNENRVRTGDLAPVELDRSRVAVLQYETAVEQAGLNLEQARTRLGRLLGRPTGPGADFDVRGAMRRETRDETSAAILWRALAGRPDLAAMRQSQARSKADVKLQLANGKVDYVLGTEYTYQRAFGFGGSSLGFSFSMPLPVFNRNQGEIARAQRESRQFEARTAALEAAIGSEVDLAFRQYQTALRLLNNIETNLLARARTVRDVTEYSYRRGEATLVEFLDAQRAFNDSVSSYDEARAAHARSLFLIDAVAADNLAPLAGK